jgi:putative flippase GtrA
VKSALRSTLARFLVVGGISYLVNQALLVAFYDGALASLSRSGFNGPLLLSSAAALELSIIVRFLLNDVWTFRDRRAKSFATRFYQSNFTSFGSPLICLATVNLLTPLFGIDYLVSNSIGILLGLAWNWFCSVRYVWISQKPVPVPVLPPHRYEEVDIPSRGRRLLRLLPVEQQTASSEGRLPPSFFLHAGAPKVTAFARLGPRLMLNGRRDRGDVRRGA